MNVPIRMLGIANFIFWIVLIAFIASAGYSVKDVNFNVGEPEFNTTASGDTTLTLPLYVDNTGYYDLKEFNVTSVVYSEQGAELSKSSSFMPIISRGHNATILHKVTLNIKQLAEINPNFLLNDSNLNARIAAGFDFAGLLPLQLSTNFTFPWRAPFHNLVLGQPRYSSTSSPGFEITVPLSFENHATFDLTGTITANLHDETGTLLAESQTSLAVPSQSNYSGELSFLVRLGSVSSSSLASGYVEICFFTSIFECGPVVIPYD